MRVYQAKDGRYILWDGKTKTFFDTESEANIMADKIKYAEKAKVFCTTLAQLFKDAPDLEHLYFDEGFDSIGSNPIIDGDIASLSISASELAAFITVAQQLQKFDVGDGGDPVATDNYGASINAMRNL